MKKKFLYITILFLCMFKVVNNANANAKNDTTIILSANIDNILVGKNTDYFEDKNNNLTINNIDTIKNKWIKSKSNALNFGFKDSTYWVKFEILNNTYTKEWILEIDNPHLDTIDLYKNGINLGKSTGDFFTFSQRAIIYRNPTFLLKTDYNELAVYHIRIRTKGTMNIPLVLWNKKEIYSAISYEMLIFGIFYGFLIFTIIYSVILFVYLKNINYLYYIFYAISYSLLLFTLSGLTFQYIFPQSHVVPNMILSLIVIIGLIISMQFTRHFLNTKLLSKNIDKLLLFLIFISSIIAVLSFILPYDFIIKIITNYGVIVCFILITIGIKRFFNGYNPARFYIVSWGTVLLGFIIFGVKTFGWLPHNLFTNWGHLWGATLHMILLLIAIADKNNINDNNKTKEINKINEVLKKRNQELNEAYKQVSHSEEKYRILVEGTNEIIFTLDEDWKFIAANEAIYEHFKITEEDLQSTKLYDLLYDDGRSVTKQVVKKKLEKLKKTKDAIRFKAKFLSPISTEPKEMILKLEYVTIEGKHEVLGKASNIIEDNLIEYFQSEKQQYVIGNYLTTTDDLCYRLTRNLRKYFSKRDVNFIRLGLREIILNAIEHGNLNISFSEKTTYVENGTYFDFFSKRRKDPKYANRKVYIDYSFNNNKVEYRIKDEGDGFDYKDVIKNNTNFANTEMLSHGRGITITKNVFDKVKYIGNGNEVVLTKNLDD